MNRPCSQCLDDPCSCIRGGRANIQWINDQWIDDQVVSERVVREMLDLDEPFWKSKVDDTPGTLTKEQLQDALEKVREEGRNVCGTGRNPHIISTKDWDSGAGRCQGCGAWVECHDR